MRHCALLLLLFPSFFSHSFFHLAFPFSLIAGCLLSCCTLPCLRNNLRRENGIGVKESPDLIGDILCCCFCGSCSMCQMLRTVDRSTWDWMSKVFELSLFFSG